METINIKQNETIQNKPLEELEADKGLFDFLINKSCEEIEE